MMPPALGPQGKDENDVTQAPEEVEGVMCQ